MSTHNEPYGAINLLWYNNFQSTVFRPLVFQYRLPELLVLSVLTAILCVYWFALKSSPGCLEKNSYRQIEKPYLGTKH